MQPAGGRQVAWDGHVLLIYATERERRDGVVAWVQRGLEADAKIVYIEPGDSLAARSLMRVLSEHEVDVTDALGRGQLQVVDPDGADFGAAWQTALVDEGLRDGYPTVRLGGESSTPWSVMSPLDHVDAEWAAEELCRTRPVSVLCQYATSVTPSTLQRACAMHTAGIRASRLRTLPARGGVAVAGEVDASNVHILRSALAAACDIVAPRGTVIVDLARLSFLDVAGARALLTGTATLRERGGVVRLRAVRPMVDRLLRQLGADRVDGVVLESAS